MSQESDKVEELKAYLPKYFRDTSPLFERGASRRSVNFMRRLRMLEPEIPVDKKSLLLHLAMGIFVPLQDGQNRFAYLAEAATKDRDAEQLLREVAAGMLHRGEELPPEIASPISALLLEMDKRPAAKRGPKPDGNRIRNGVILVAINALKELGVNPMRNREQKDIESGCSIVTRALQDADIPKMTEAAVEKIWCSRPGAAPPSPKRTPQPRKRA